MRIAGRYSEASGWRPSEMLAGDPPHMGSTSQAIIARVLTEKPRSVRVSRPNVPEFVDAALERALEKLPADRFASAAGFSAALNGSTPAGTSNSVAPSSGAAKRHAGVPRVLPLATMAIAVGAIMTWLVMRGTGNPGDATHPRQFSIVLPDSMPFTVATDPYGTGLKSFDLAPDGRTLVYTSATPSGHRLVIVDLDDDVATPLRRGDGGRSPAFSPDGRSVAAVAGDSEVRAFSWGDGSTTQIAARHPLTILWRASRMYFDGGCSSASATGGDLRPDKGPACQSDWVMSEAAPIGTRSDSMLLHVQGAIKIVSASTGGVRDLTVPAPSGAGAETPLHGSAPHFVAPGYLIFVQGSTLFAAPFDARTLHVTGQPRAVLSKIRKEQSGLAQLSISNDGTLVWAEGGDGALSRFVWVTPADA